MAKNKSFNKPKLYPARVTLNSRSATISFPRKIIEYLNLQSAEIYWVPINGTIQISGTHPNIAIPMLKVDTKSFTAQSV